MSHLHPPLPDLAVPEAEIIRQAGNSTSLALRLAAAYGYGVACRDLDRIGALPLEPVTPHD